MSKAIYAMLVECVQRAGQGLPPGDLDKLKDALDQLARKHIKEVADEKVQRIKLSIADLMEDAQFHTALSGFLVDYAHNTHAVLCGPEFALKDVLKYDDTAPGCVITTKRMEASFRSVDPLTFYWTSDSVDPGTGTGVIEDALIRVNDLLDAVENEVPGYIAEAIDRITQQSWRYNHALTPTDSHLAQIRKDEALYLGVEGTKRRIMYRGLLPGRLLKAHKQNDPNFKEARMYECEVWVIEGTTVYLRTDVNPMVNRPYYTASLYNRGKTMVGNGIPDVLYTTERMCNAAMRAMAKNMPYAADPFAEVDINRMVDPEDITNFTLRPGKTYKVEADPLGGGQRAIAVAEIPSNVDKFLAVYNSCTQEADRVCGIPAYVAGTLDIASMARTMGGLSILMRAATVVLQNGVTNLDDRGFTRMIRTCYNWLMLYHPDTSIKADAAVQARGASGVLNRELSQAKLQELLQLLAPFAQGQLIPPEVVLQLVREIIEGSGYDASKLIPPNAASSALQFANALAAANPPTDGTGAPTMPVPPSAGAVSAA